MWNMWLINLVAISFLFFITSFIFLRIAVCLLSWYLQRHHEIKLRIRKVCFLRLSGIYVQLKNGNTLEIEKLWLSSSIFHTKLKGILALCMSDIRLQGDAEWIAARARNKTAGDQSRSRTVTVPSFITSLLKMCSLNAMNASIMQLGMPQQEFLLHVSLQELNVFSKCNTDSVTIHVSSMSSAVKVFKHPPLAPDQQRRSSDSCLAHLTFNVDTQLQISVGDPISFQCLEISVMQPELMLYEDVSISKLKLRTSSEPLLQGTEHASSLTSSPTLTSEEEIGSANRETDESPKFLKLLKKFPEVALAKIELLSIKLMKEGGHRAFTMDIKSIEGQLKKELIEGQPFLPTVQSFFAIEDVHAASGHRELAHLIKASAELDLNVVKKSFSSKILLSSFHISYERDVLQYWLGIIPLNSNSEKTVKSQNYSSTKKRTSLWMWFKGYHINHTTEMEDICLSAKLADGLGFSLGLDHVKCTFESVLMALGAEDCPAQSPFLCSDVSLELLLEAAYMSLGQKALTDYGAMKRNHFWNVPFSIGMILLQMRYHSSNYVFKCMVDSIQGEWNPDLACLVQEFKKTFHQTNEVSQGALSCDQSGRNIAKGNNAEFSVPRKDFTASAYSVHLSFTGINMFGLSDAPSAIVLRTDLFNLSASKEQLSVTMEGSKLAMVPTTSQCYPCVKSSEMRSYVAHLSHMHLSHRLKIKETSIQLSDEVYMFWNTTFHMTALTIAQEIIAFKSSLLARNEHEIKEKSSQRSSTLSLLLKCQGNISIGLVLSSDHRIIFSSSELTLSLSQDQRSAQTESLTVYIDSHKIFTFQHLIISLAQGTEQHMLSRLSFDNLEQSNNRLLNIHMEELKFVFPHEYDFAEAFSEQFINIIKWLKVVHQVKKKPFILNSLLPPDLSIKTKVWTIEIEDDPFEVKLRNNFELLEDEYQESLKRKRMLDEKIENIKRTHILLADEKINELYSKLAKKNADIYVRRYKQLYPNGPSRTSLVTWQLDDVEILAIADTSYHGTERVVQKMKIIDMESPFPEEGLDFTTLWCRKVRCSASSWNCNLRDFPQPLLQIRELHVWGLLIGAEQEASHRAKRTSVIEISGPWFSSTVERSMPSLKFYHDLTFDLEDMCMAYGPCWEPLMSQYGLSMEYVSKPSLDPSPVLPWWDKIRLLLHGRLTLSIQHLVLLLRASLDPYNTTEQMEVSWTDVIIEWTNGKILTKGDLDIYVHTASKYDDCRVLHIPSLKLSISVDWLCLGNPNDHHSVMPCAPDKIPEYSINQEHDSYRAFRSQNVNVAFSFETRNVIAATADIPTMLLYSSTFRWIENLKMILTGVTRLTRRGKLFSNTRPRKPQLSRHYRNLRVSLNLHRFQICYWMSFAKQRGLELLGGRLSLSSEHTQTLSPVSDGLMHRPRSNWSIGYLNSELCDSEIWLYNCLELDASEESKSFDAPVGRSYFLSVNRVSYGREEIVKDVMSDEDKADTPTHRLVVHTLKGAWTKHNRGVVFSLFDSYMRTVILKKNLSTDALRGFKMETQNTPQKLRAQSSATQASSQACQASHSPVSHLQSGHAASMLQKLIAEAEANPMVFTEEIEGSTREQQLHGVAACQTDDVLQKNWLIELVNSQVMLRGYETSGYVIVSAAKAQILQRLHRPVWKDRTLVSKTTWVGSLECMQYYATVDAGEPGPSVDNVMWLSLDNIEERESMVISDLPDLVGSGQSVGGVVSNTVGAASDPDSAPIQLQRIVSRCGCQFFYASYGENVDAAIIEEVPPLPEDSNLWEQEVAVDSFTLTHHDLDICTNSLQYAMILDLVNNLLLYVEPRKKEAIEKLQYMRFQLQLCSIDDQKEPILRLQENVRNLLSELRRLEKAAYAVHRLACENPDEEEYLQELQQLEQMLYEHKEQLNAINEELTVMISCFKETQIMASRSRQRSTSQEKGVTVTRRSEVCFKHAQWRLTDADGQLGIADLVLSNFLYSKVTKSDDSVEHLLELGYVKMTNLLPNQLYKHVLQPTEVQTKIPLDRQRLLRIYCRERAPVGGISIKEHLEVNVIPITIGLTDAFYKAMLKFFFPGRDTEKPDDHRDDEHDVSASHSKKHPTLSHQKGSSTFYSDRDDIEKMKERADKNHTFFYIKIPEVPLRVSYKGKKEKNIEDVHDLSLVLSTLEYHNKTWTWLDLLMGLKYDAKKILLAQAIKQTILKSNRHSPEKDNQPQEEEKASILLGPKYSGTMDKTGRKRRFR